MGREWSEQTQVVPFEDAFGSPFDSDEDEGTSCHESCDHEQERRLSLRRKDSATCRICLEGHGPMTGAVSSQFP